MAGGKKISELTELTNVQGAEYFPVSDGTTNKKVKTGNFALADEVYSKTNADSTFLKKTDASSTYLSKTDAGNTYLKKTDAEANYASAEDLGALQEDVEGIQSDVEELKLAQSDYGVESYNMDQLDPECLAFYGNKDFLLKYDFYLLDTTDNAGQTTTPVGKLKRNNLLRFEDGSFAPTIGITAEQKAECDVALYLDATHTQKWCDAGEFDAEEFYNEKGMAKLYDVNGDEVRVLRPWETTETKYTIGFARRDTVYLLDNVEGSSGKVWKGLFSRPMFWDGIDVSQFPLPPTAISPSPVCTVGNKTRCFLYVYKGETNCQSSKGQNNLCTMFYDQNMTYPRTSDMQQVKNMQYARANNADTDAPYPFAEGGFHALNTYITALEVFYGDKYIHDANMFGSGISSNDSCDNESNWLVNGGVRYKKTEDSSWTYTKWSSQGNIYYDADGGRNNFNVLLNQQAPHEACMESQMAMSFAVETEVQADTDFEFYGNTYNYKVVPGTDGIESLNVRLYKKMSQTFNAYTSAGVSQSWDVEVNLRMSLFGGVNLSGDHWAYWGGGIEMVGTCTNAASPSTGNPVKLYIEPDQLAWHSETAITKDNNGVFDFESDYRDAGEFTNLGDGYSLRREPYTCWKSKKGGSISTGECHYAYDNKYWSSVLNQRARIACRFRGSANRTFCSARSLAANYAVSNTTRYNGGSAQALINVGAAPLQAE